MSKETIKAKSFVEKLRMIDPEMQLQSVMALLLISEGHETESWYTVKELAKKIGISPASASRNVAVLSKWNRHDKKGHDLVVSWETPKKRVEKFVKLTSKGERFMQELKKAFVQ